MGRTTAIAALCVTMAAAALGGCTSPQRWQSTLATHNAAGTNSGNTTSTEPVISADGTKVAFVSYARNFGLPDTNEKTDVFVRDLETGEITMASVNRLGTNSGNQASDDPVLSPDGTKVAFRSPATNLQAVPVETLGFAHHVYVRDLVAGTTTLVTIEVGGTGGLGELNHVARYEFSPDGSKLVFDSAKANLAPNDPDAYVDVFVRDLAAGTTTLVSVDAAGSAPGNGPSQRPRFGPDGATVAFESSASDLVGDDTNGRTDVFVRDLAAGTTAIVTPGADGDASNVELSADGTRMVFESTSTNLGPTDTNGVRDVYVHDLVSGTTTLASARPDGTDSGDGESFDPVISPDGNNVAFTSAATDLAGTDTNEETDVYVRDVDAGTTSLASVDADGSDSGLVRSQRPLFAGNGEVIFESQAWNLGPNDTNNTWDLYVRDLAGERTALVSARADGADSGDDMSTTAAFGAGRIAYQSLATDLAGTDTNSTWDIYVAAPYTEPPPPLAP